MNEVALVLAVSYVVGSFPTSIVAAKLLRDVDIRSFGSGNAGATNVLRLMGWKAMLLVMTVDVFKGWLCAGVVSAWAAGPPLSPDATAMVCGGAAIAGHVFPVFAGFRGGRGGAPLAGVLLHVFPAGLAAGSSILIATVVLTGYVSLGTILAALSLPLTAFVLYEGIRSPLGYFCLTVAVFITWTHKANISRLLRGAENRFERVRISWPRGMS